MFWVMGTYVAFTTQEIEAFFKATGIPAEKKVIPGVYESVYDIPVVGKSGRKFPAMVRVYSSIALGEDRTREVGTDAIRIQLLNTAFKTDRFPDGVPIKGAKKTAFRTLNAMPNTRDRIRDLYARGMRQSCSNCAGMMIKKKSTFKSGEFYGCPNYKDCHAPTKSVDFVEKGIT